MRAQTQGERYKWVAFIAVAMGVYAWVVDATAFSIALPEVSSHFSAGLPTIQWVVLIYLLVITALLMPMGRAADVLGWKRLYIAGLAIYVVGALLGASAQNVPWLLAARAVQAVGSAAIQGIGMAIAVAVFPPEERGRVLGLNVFVVAVGATTGPVFGGLLVDAFGWQSVLVTTALLALAAMAIGYVVLKQDRLATADAQRGSLDWLGMVTSAVAIIAMVLVLSQGQSAGWTSPLVLTAGGVAVAALAAFLVAELKVPQPMIALTLFTRRRFALGNASTLLSFAAASGSAFLMPFYLQGVLGIQATTTGLVLAPFAVMIGVVGPIAGRLSDRIGFRAPAVLGLSVACGSLIALSRLDADSSAVHVALIMMAMGAGIGTFGPANTSSILGTVDRKHYGLGTGFYVLMRNMGQVTGVAVATLVITLAITSLGVAPDIGLLRDEGATSNPLLVNGFVTGMRKVYLVFAGMMALGALLSVVPASRPAERAAERRPVAS